MNSEDYKRQLVKLLPRGLAWYFEDENNVPKMLHAWADEFEVLDGAAESFLEEFYPDTTTQFLPDWERVSGLPDECSGLAATIALRRKDLISRLTSVGGQTPQYFIDLAAELGYTITITEFNPFRASISAAGDACYSEEWQNVWQVNAALDTIEYFRAGVNAAGDPLATWGNERLECLINKLKPAHTHVIFSYS